MVNVGNIRSFPALEMTGRRPGARLADNARQGRDPSFERDHLASRAEAPRGMRSTPGRNSTLNSAAHPDHVLIFRLGR
jgi:hypothetical protein